MNAESDLPSSNVKKLSILIGTARTAVGAGFFAVPQSVMEGALETGSLSPEAETALRMTAARDLALGLGTLITSFRKSPSRTGWLLGGILADSIDFYAFARDHSLRLFPKLASGAVAGGAVVLGIIALTE